jgi:hypothetical protein
VVKIEQKYKPSYFMKGETEEARRTCKEDESVCQMRVWKHLKNPSRDLGEVTTTVRSCCHMRQEPC